MSELGPGKGKKNLEELFLTDEDKKILNLVEDLSESNKEMYEMVFGEKDKLDKTVFESALEKIGKEEQFWMVVEECGELISEINKVRRGRTKKLEYLMEEVVDVFIMMKQMRYINPRLFDKIYSEKVARLRRKLGMGE